MGLIGDAVQFWSSFLRKPEAPAVPPAQPTPPSQVAAPVPVDATADVGTSRDPRYLISELQNKWPMVKSQYETIFPDRELFLTCTYRTPKEQQRLYAQGRTAPGNIVTEKDGVLHKSKHNVCPARAMDVGVKVDGTVCWGNSFFEPLGPICDGLGLAWGGHWDTLKDYPHIEAKVAS